MKGIHQNILNFFILDTNDPKSMVFVDASEYIENPEKPILEIVLPGMNKYLLVNISPRKVNTFTSNTFNLTPTILNECETIDLPDGIYRFKYKICPYKYINRVKYYLRITSLSNKLNHILDKLDCEIELSEKLKQEIIDILILIESAKASAELGNNEKASNKYKLADKKTNILVDKIIK